MADQSLERIRLLTIDDVAELLQVTKDWIYDVTQKGKFPCVKIGRQLRFRPAEIEAYINGEWKAEGPQAQDPPPPLRPRVKRRSA